MEYKQTTVVGEITSWTRSHQINIMNAYGENPVAVFREEVVTQFPDDSIVKKDAGFFVVPMPAPTDSFPLLDESGSVTGSMTYAELEKIITSLYIAQAQIRDASVG